MASFTGVLFLVPILSPLLCHSGDFLALNFVAPQFCFLDGGLRQNPRNTLLRAADYRALGKGARGSCNKPTTHDTRCGKADFPLFSSVIYTKLCKV